MTYYVIINSVNITNTMLLESHNHEYEGLRFNADKSKAILKFSSATPNSMQGYTKYTLTELEAIFVNNEEWQETGPVP